MGKVIEKIKLINIFEPEKEIELEAITRDADGGDFNGQSPHSGYVTRGGCPALGGSSKLLRTSHIRGTLAEMRACRRKF